MDYILVIDLNELAGLRLTLSYSFVKEEQNSNVIV